MDDRRTRRPCGWRAWTTGLVIALSVTACGTSDDAQTASDTASRGDAPATTVAPGFAERPADEPADDGGGDGDAAGGGSESGAPDVEIADSAVPEDRRIIRTANVLTEVVDVADAAAAVRAAALAADGYLFSQELSEEYGAVVVKVPADRFDGALDTMTGIGEVRRQSTSAEDVTARYADLDGRLDALQTSIDRLLGFLAAATDIGEVATLESELTRREAERDSIAGQLQVLENQTAFSTITVELALPDNLPDDPDDDRDGFLGGLDDGLDVLGSIGSGIATVAGFAVPFLPVFVGAAGIAWAVRRRTRRPSGTPPAPTGSTGGGTTSEDG